MRISCTSRIFVILPSTTSTASVGISIRGGRVICPSLNFFSLRIVVAVPFMKTTVMTTCLMVSKYWMNDKSNDKELKKGKRKFGYAGVRDTEQEGL